MCDSSNDVAEPESDSDTDGNNTAASNNNAASDGNKNDTDGNAYFDAKRCDAYSKTDR